MRLQRLTGLERDKLEAEYQELLEKIKYFKSILEDDTVLRGVIDDELTEIRKTYTTPRRSVLLTDDPNDINIEDLIADDDTVITLSQRGYVKRTPLSNYQSQKRGGKGVAGVQTGDGDFVHNFLLTTNHQTLLLFTNLGRMYQLKVHQVPEGSRYAKGVHIANLVPLSKDEYVATALATREFDKERFLLFVTKRGMVKRSSMELYGNCRSTGIKAVTLKEGDELMTVKEVPNETDCLLITAEGISIRFNIQDARPMGRVAAGVKGIALREKDQVVAAVIAANGRDNLLTVSEGGYGKRTHLDQYRLQTRGGKGIINMRVTAKTGPVLGAILVGAGDEVVLLTSGNKIIRMDVSEISQTRGRATQGVRLVQMDGGHVAGFDLVLDKGIDEGE